MHRDIINIIPHSVKDESRIIMMQVFKKRRKREVINNVLELYTGKFSVLKMNT